MANFSDRHVYSASSHYPMSIMAKTHFPSGDFADEGDDVPFRDAMRH